MLTKKQVEEIKEYLELSQNPLFLFDNDNDGLISFLLLRRFLQRGKGIVIKSYPELNVSYYKRVQELKPDYIFILDKPVVDNNFFEKAIQENIPIIWIDHHQPDQLIKNQLKNYKNIYYYNPLKSKTKKSSEPVSYLSYKITNKKEDIWLALIGCISDALIPDFYSDFQLAFPELAKKNPSSAFDILYNSEIGKIARILNFSLKDKTKNIINMFNFMIQTKNPYDILEENEKTLQITKRYNEINSKYQKLVERARKQAENKLIYFQYQGDLSLSADIANQLNYEFPDKIIVVAYIKDNIANISLRGKNIRNITLEAIKNIENATGGGHENATGAKMSSSQLPEFKDNIERLIKD